MKRIALVQFGNTEEAVATVFLAAAIRNNFEKVHLDIYFDACHESLLSNYEIADRQYFINSDSGQLNLRELSSLGINNHEYDDLYNLSLGEFPAQLASYLTSVTKSGMFFDHENNVVIEDGWARYLAGTSSGLSLNPFHIIDVYRFMCGMQESGKDFCFETHALEDQSLHEFFEKPVVCIDIGRQSDDELQTLADTISSVVTGIRFLIVTDSTTRQSSENCIFLSRDKFAESQLLSVVDKSSLLFTDRSDMSAYASLVDTFCLYIGSQNDTGNGPYGHGHLQVLVDESKRNTAVPAIDICREIIEEAISTEDGQIPDADHWLEFFKPLKDLDSDILSVSLKQQVIDQGMRGTIVHEQHDFPLFLSAGYNDSLYQSIYRVMWHLALNDHETTMTDIKSFLKIDIQQTMLEKEKLGKVRDLALFGCQYSNIFLQHLNSAEKADNEELSKIATNLEEIDEMLQSLADNSRFIVPLVNFYKITQYYISTDDSRSVAVSSTRAYTQLNYYTTAIIDLLDTGIDNLSNSKKIADNNIMTGREI